MCGIGEAGVLNENEAVNVGVGPPPSSQQSGRDQGEIYGDSNANNDNGSLTEIPSMADNNKSGDPERITVREC